MHKIHVFQYQDLWFHGRHGSVSGKPHVVGGCGFMRLSGLFARAWAFLYSKTKDPKYLKWAKDQVELCAKLRDPQTGFYPTQVFPPPGKTYGVKKYPPATVGTQPIAAALGFLDAAEWLDNPADKKMFVDRAKDMALVNFKRYYGWDGKKFTKTQPNTIRGWAWTMLKFWERAGRPALLLKHAKAIAEDVMQQWKPLKGTDAGGYGYRIMFFVQMYRETGETRYLDYARRLGDYAAANLVTENGLVVGAAHYRIYDRMYHVPKLIQAFLALDHPKHPAVQPLFRVVR